MALHIRSLQLKSCNLPNFVARCFATQIQNSNFGDKRPVTCSDVDWEWESIANEVSTACEEAKKQMRLLAYVPATSRIAVLILESQRLVEAVNKHASVVSLLQTSKTDRHLNTCCHDSAETLSGQSSQTTSHEGENCSLSKLSSGIHEDRSIWRSETAGQTGAQPSPVIALEHFRSLGDLIKPYSYTTDDIIIRKSIPVSVFDPWKEGPEKQRNGGKFPWKDNSCGPNFNMGKLKHAQETQHIDSRWEVSHPKDSGRGMYAIIDSSWKVSGSLSDLYPIDKTMENMCGLSSTLLYADLPPRSEEAVSPSKKPSPKQGGPNRDQLLQIQDHFATNLPKFFVQKQDFRVYHPDIVFENNFWGTNIITKGLSSYIVQLNKIRILAVLKFAHSQMEVLKITTHTEDGTVRIRWRIKGLSQLKALQFWKFLPWGFRKSVKDELQWYDGFSTLHIGVDGLVHKHRLDRVMPDEETETVKSGNLAMKLGILLGLAPKPSLTDFASLLCKKSTPRTVISGQQ